MGHRLLLRCSTFVAVMKIDERWNCDDVFVLECKRLRITWGDVRGPQKAGCRLSLSGSPVMRQKFGDAVDGVIADASEDVLKPGEGLDIHALARSYETA